MDAVERLSRKMCYLSGLVELGAITKIMRKPFLEITLEAVESIFYDPDLAHHFQNPHAYYMWKEWANKTMTKIELQIASQEVNEVLNNYRKKS